MSFRLALAAAKYLCRHRSVGLYRLVDDLLRDSSMRLVFAELGVVEVVGGTPLAPRPGTPEWWRAYGAVRDAVLYLETRGVVKYLPKLEVVNWAGRPCAPSENYWGVAPGVELHAADARAVAHSMHNTCTKRCTSPARGGL
jgi:hypothetical protein